MLLLSVINAGISFADRTLFSGASFEIYDKDKVGLVGVNGSGKTTLFKLIKGELSPDEGEIHAASGKTVGYMEQFACKNSRKTLYDEALSLFSDIMDLELELEEIHDKIDYGDHGAEIIERQTRLTEEFERRGGLTYKSRTKAALLGLGFTQSDFSLDVSVLSGGQKSKLQLAKLLLSEADLLLLDEPTNHLDIESVEWLEGFLADYKGAYFVISHDRYFLNKVTSRTVVLENGHIRAYNGNYSAYMKQREIETLTVQRNYDATVQEIQRLEVVVDQQRRWKHKKNQKTHTVDNKLKAIERLEKTLEKPEEAPEEIKFSFKCEDGCGNDVLQARGISLSFDDKRLFSGVDIDIKKGERVFLIGSNGCGKTSLFRVLTGEYKADRGEFKLGARVKTGYFDQAQRGLHDEKTAFSEIHDEYPKMTETAVRTALATFLFKGDDVFKSVSALSGGERARIALLKLMLSGANFLLLDEPTNHLDISSCEALENALSGYDGTLFVISHDRYLINKLADRVYKLSENGAEGYLGNYDYYIEHSAEKTPEKAAEKPKMSEQALDYKQRKERESERRKLATKISRLEGEIEELENQIKALNEKLSGVSDYQDALELSGELEALQKRSEEALREWEQASAQLEEISQ